MNFDFDIENKQEIIAWLERIKKGSGDARPLWHALDPKVVEFVEDQFRPTSDSGKRWKKLTPKYLKWKLKKGYPAAIGYRKGYLIDEAGENAIKTFKPESLVFKVRADKAWYVKYFNKKRNIYRNITARANSFLATDVKKFNDGSSHNSFTVAWMQGVWRRAATK